MNWQDNELFQNINKKRLGIILTVIFVLIVAVVTLTIIKNARDDAEKASEEVVIQMEEVTAANKSNTNVTPYLESLHATIKATYIIPDGYEIATGELLEDDTWYITTIWQPPKTQWDFANDIYRVILHKTNNKWTVVTKPSLIFAYADYPDIPKPIIKSINEFTPKK